MRVLDLITVIIICIKIAFLILILTDFYLSTETKKSEKYINVRSQLKVIYIILMGILLLICFNPFVQVTISKEHKHLIFLFAIILIFDTVPEIKTKFLNIT